MFNLAKMPLDRKQTYVLNSTTEKEVKFSVYANCWHILSVKKYISDYYGDYCR